MFRPYPASLVLALTVAALHAAEVTVEEHPFVIEAAFNASLMPEGAIVLLQLDAKSWEDFRILDLADHGSMIPKDGLLAAFDTTGIDRKLEDTRSAVASGSLAVTRAGQELKILQETAPHLLEAARRAAETAAEDHAYFKTTRRKAEEQTSAQSLERSKQHLSDQQEELRQLTKMYQADDLTEETEEIILTRQKDDVAAAEFALRMETLRNKRTLETNLPREAVTLANNERDTAIALSAAEEEIPASIEIKKLELASLATNLRREKETLADLEHDRSLFEIKAPGAGWFYHGPMEDGRWTTGEIVKTLVRNGRPPIRRPFATFIPADATFVFGAFLDAATARPLQPGLTGTATFPGREDIEVPVKLTRIAAAPESDGTYRAVFSATWPKELKLAAGASAEIRLITYQQPAAILVPNKALAHDARGWTVELMLADGKTERRPVKRGRVSKEQTEILSGLEIGQVIIAP